MRLNAFIQTFVLVAFGLWFVIIGIIAFNRVSNSQQQFEAKLQSIQAGKIQPDALTAIRKYVNPGKGGSSHIVFRSNRQPEVDIAVTVVFFNSVNVGDTVPGYYFPEGYFILQNHRGDSGAGKWLFLGIGVLLGGGLLAFAVARARKRPPYGDMVALRAIIRDRTEGH